MFNAALLFAATISAAVAYANGFTFLLRRTQFPQIGDQCNIYDDGAVCREVRLDKKLRSTNFRDEKCQCPRGWYCPTDPLETIYQEKCYRQPWRSYLVCRMRCVPNESRRSSYWRRMNQIVQPPVRTNNDNNNEV